MPSIFLENPVPTEFVAVTPHDTNTINARCVVLLVNVTVAAVLPIQTWGTLGTSTNIALAVGSHQIRGNFARVLSTGSSGTFTVVAGIFNPRDNLRV